MARAAHVELLSEGVAADGAAFRALFAGRPGEARERLREAAALYLRSWELAPPRSFGRLVAYLKSAVLAGDGAEAAAYANDALGGACDSPTSCYALALAALAAGDDAAAADPAERMRDGDEAFGRAAEALAALAAADAERYRRAVTAIVRDFEGRDAYLTGVPVADTAMLMEALARPRGLAADPASALIPAGIG